MTNGKKIYVRFVGGKNDRPFSYQEDAAERTKEERWNEKKENRLFLASDWLGCLSHSYQNQTSCFVGIIIRLGHYPDNFYTDNG